MSQRNGEGQRGREGDGQIWIGCGRKKPEATGDPGVCVHLFVDFPVHFPFALHGEPAWPLSTRACYVVCSEQETVIGCCNYDNQTPSCIVHV